MATAVLVLSTDVLAAALVGALAEIAGRTPAFARPGEPPRDALRRVRAHVVLVDQASPDACDAAFLGPARRLGARAVLFGPARIADQLRDGARPHGAGLLGLPADADAMRRALDGEE